MTITALTTSSFREHFTQQKLQKSTYDLKKVLRMNIGKMTFAHKQAKEDNSNLDDVTKDDSSRGDEISITDRILRCISENRIREPKRRRYKNCKKYFVLLSFMGPHDYGLLHAILMFPSYRNVQI